MKVNGITMQEAGYSRPSDEETMIAKSSGETVKGKGKSEKYYATIFSNNKEMPLDLSGVKSGDKLMLACVVNVKEITSIDKKDGNEPDERFTLEILQCGCEKTTEKAPEEMDDKELDEAIKTKTGKGKR
jgi:hypothetical protein